MLAALFEASPPPPPAAEGGGAGGSGGGGGKKKKGKKGKEAASFDAALLQQLSGLQEGVLAAGTSRRAPPSLVKAPNPERVVEATHAHS